MADLLIRRDDAETRLYLSGEIDMATAPQFYEALAEAIRAWDSVDIDMAEVTFLDSSGIHALGRAAACVSPGNEVRLRNTTESVLLVLEMTGIDELKPLRIV